jgi:hypothetical protein
VPDHWAAYGLSETAGDGETDGDGDGDGEAAGDDGGDGDGAEVADVGRGLSSDERAYARHQAGAFGAQVRWFAQRFGPWGIVTRGFRGVPRGGGYGVVGEALTGLWRVARVEPELADIEGPVAERALCNAGQAIEAQATAADAADDIAPDRVAGAWFRGGETRMDDQQHMISALLRTEAIADAGPTGRDGPTPPAWLWIVALVAALNPLRVAVARRVRTNAPAAEHQARPAEPVVTAALGAAGGAVVVLGAALLADRLASLAHVSPPSLRLAAGALGIAGGLTALLLRPVSAAPIVSRRRWVGAAVPIGVAVANPALVVGGLAAGLDSGVAVVAISLVLGVAAVAAAVALDHRALDRSAPSVTGDGGSPAGDGGPEAAPVSVATGGTTGGAAGGTDGGGPGETAGRPSGPAEAGPVEAGPVEFGGAPVEAGGAPDGAGGAPDGAGGAPDGAERGDADRSPASGRTAWQRRVLTWGGRVTGVVLVVASALLIFDAVYAP